MPVTLITGGKGVLAQALAGELESCGHEVHAPGREDLDVTSSASTAAHIARLSQLDLLICNAGICDDAPVVKMGEEQFARVLDVNLTGAFRAARAALRLMCRQRAGHIVFIGSFSSLRGPAGQANYAAAKAGLMALTQSLAAEYGERGIRVNCVLPGFMETPMTEALVPELQEAFRQAHALRRFNTPAETSSFVRFLHENLTHTSGQIFNLDSRVHRWA